MTENEAVKRYFGANPNAKRIFDLIQKWDFSKTPKENAGDLGITHNSALNMANRFGLYKKILISPFKSSRGKL